MNVLSKLDKFNKVKVAVKKIDHFLNAGFKFEVYEGDGRTLIIEAESIKDIYVELDFVVCSELKNEDFFMLIITNKKINNENSARGYFDVLDWANYKNIEISHEQFVISGNKPGFVDQLNEVVDNLNKILNLTALNEIIQGNSWEEVPFDWSCGHR